MNLYDEFFALVEAFEESGIAYAVIGGFAMAFHDEPRFTEDIDILIGSAELERASNILTKLDFFFFNGSASFFKYKVDIISLC